MGVNFFVLGAVPHSSKMFALIDTHMSDKRPHCLFPHICTPMAKDYGASILDLVGLGCGYWPIENC